MFVLRHWSTFVGKVLHENAGQLFKNEFESFGANSNFVRRTRIFCIFHRRMLRPAKNEGCKMFVSTGWTIYFLEVLSKNAGQPFKNEFESTSVHVIVKIPNFSRTRVSFWPSGYDGWLAKGWTAVEPTSWSLLPKYFAVDHNGSQDARGRRRAWFWVEYFLQFMSRIFQ